MKTDFKREFPSGMANIKIKIKYYVRKKFRNIFQDKSLEPVISF